MYKYLLTDIDYKSTTDDLTDNYFAMSSWYYDGGNKKEFQNPTLPQIRSVVQMHGLNFIAFPLPYVSLNLSGHLGHSLKHALHVFFSLLKTYDAILAIELRCFMTCIYICILWCYSAYAATMVLCSCTIT